MVSSCTSCNSVRDACGQRGYPQGLSGRAPPRAKVAAMPPKVNVRRVSDLLAIVPYLLGYHPHDGLVLVATRRGLVVGTLTGDDQALLAGTAARLGADCTFLIGYGDRDRIVDVRVRDGRYWWHDEPGRT